MSIYTVHAYRWGDRERHSYIVGIYSTEALALQAAETEEEWRGGKYTCEIRQWEIDHGEAGDSKYKSGLIRALPFMNTLDSAIAKLPRPRGIQSK